MQIYNILFHILPEFRGIEVEDLLTKKLGGKKMLQILRNEDSIYYVVHPTQNCCIHITIIFAPDSNHLLPYIYSSNFVKAN